MPADLAWAPSGHQLQPKFLRQSEDHVLGLACEFADAARAQRHFDLEFLKPWKSKAKDNWLFEAWGNNETKVTWQNSGALPWPMASLMGPMIIKNLNFQFQQGLNNLKQMCEA